MQIPHLVELGITAVELLPVFEYDELEFQRSSNPRDHMVNIWGYSHLSFFAPMSRFGSGAKGPAAAAKEFKQLVKALHASGIEVILDVVYNHTVEGMALYKERLPIRLNHSGQGSYSWRHLRAILTLHGKLVCAMAVQT